MFEIEQADVAKLQKEQPLELPLEQMNVGNGFRVPASLSGRFQAVRTAVSRYNIKHNTMIRCTADGKDLYVWRDTDDSADNGGRKREPKLVTLKTRKSQWQEWLKACAFDVDALIPASLLEQQGIDWQTLKQWSNELYESSHCEWSVLMFDTTTVTVRKTRAA